jgi:type I restriction enzyme S subunit
MSEAAQVPQLRFPEFSGAWEEKNVGDVLTIGSGRDYKHLNNGDIPVYGTGGYMTSVDNFLYDGESVCIGRKGTIDKPVLIDGKFWTVDTLFYTHSFIDILPKFLFPLFKRINWKKYNEASGVPSLSKSTIEKIKLNLPTLSEQQKIAAFLTSVDNKIEQLSKKQELLGEYKKGLMQKIFSQAIRFKADDDSDFLDWEEKILSEYLIIKATYGIVKAGEFQDAGIKMVRGGDIKNGRIKPNSPFVSDEISHEYRRTKLELNDVVISLVGYPGESAIIPKDLIGHNISRAVGLLRLNNKINNEYFVQYLNSYSGRKNVLRPSAGSAQQVVNLKDLNILKIPAPPLPEQTKIANFLSSIDNKIEQVGKQLDESKQFKKALLQQMFV